MDAVLQALSDESRTTVLEVLRGGPTTVGDLAARLPIARPGVSRHLRVLREAGLVDVRQEAQFRVYSLCPEPLAQVDAWLGRYRPLWEHRMDAPHTEVARGKREWRSRLHERLGRPWPCGRVRTSAAPAGDHGAGVTRRRDRH